MEGIGSRWRIKSECQGDGGEAVLTLEDRRGSMSTWRDEYGLIARATLNDRTSREEKSDVGIESP